MSQCTAKSKRTHERCQRPAMHGSTVCYHHGGKSRKGIAHPSFKDGRYSKALPSAMLEKYHEAVNDPELLNMRHDIALVDARLSELLKRSEAGESRTLWQQARNANDSIRQAMDNENWPAMESAVRDLDRLVGEGLADHEVWHEIGDLIDQRRKLVESEQKRLVAMKQLITSQQAMTLIAALAAIVKKRVTDPRVLSEIQNDLTLLMTIPAQTVEAD